MTRLSWGVAGERFYEVGADRGVLYVAGETGVPWNGLISVSESPSGGEPNPYYADGLKYINITSAEEYEATIEAYASPKEFGVCDGTGNLANGLYVGQQPRKSFGLVYRTLIGNDTEGLTHGYKLHIIYNALAGPSDRDHSTMSDSSEPVTYSWDITTTPPKVSGYRPTAHYIVDSRTSDPIALGYLEGVLYGGENLAPRLPTPSELTGIFSWQASGLDTPIHLLGVTGNETEFVENLNTNPSFETSSGTVNVRTNLATNPSLESSPGTVQVRKNHATNPAFENATVTLEIRRNLFSNPSVRLDLSHWSSRWFGNAGGNGVTERFSTGGFGGTGYIRKRWTADGAAADNGINVSDVSAIPVVAGKAYSASIYARTNRISGVPSFRVWIDWRDSAGALITEGPSGTIGSVPNTGNWTRFELNNAVAPAGATSAIVYFSNRGEITNWVIGDTFDWSAMLMQEGTSTELYFDGSSVGINHALGKPVSHSGGVQGNLARLTDGAFEDSQQWWSPGNLAALSSVTVDLGSIQRIDQVKVWHYYADSRVYNQTKTEISEDGITWTTLYDSAISGTYAESANGQTYAFTARGVRYIRDWLNGNNLNAFAHWVEIQAWETSPAITYSWVSQVNNSQSKAVGSIPAGTIQRVGAIGYQTISPNGRKRVAVRATGGNTDSAVAIGGDNSSMYPGLAGGKTYTISASIFTPKALTGVLSDRRQKICLFHKTASDPGYTYVYGSVGPETGSGRVSLTVSLPVGTTEAFFRLYNGSGTYGETVYWEDLLIEEAPVMLSYFDGSTPASGDLTYAWSGAVNGSYSAQNAKSVTAWSAVRGNIYQSTDRPLHGTFIGRHRTTDLTFGGNAQRAQHDVNVTAGLMYTYMAYVRRNNGGTMNSHIQWYTSTNTVAGDTFGTATVDASGWVQIRQVVTAPTGAVRATIWIGTQSEPKIYGETFDVDSLVVVLGDYSGPYFDGNTAASDDFVYAWTGGVNASTSIQRAPALVGYTQNSTIENAVVYQGSSGALSGSKVARLLMKGSAATGAVTGFAERVVAVAGLSYTAFASIRQDAGAYTSRYAQAFLYFYDSTGTLIDFGGGDKYYMDGSFKEAKISMTAPANTTHVRAAVNVYAVKSGDLFTYDTFILTNDDYTTDSPYFDGDTQDVIIYRRQQVFPQWEATAHASVSEFSFYPSLDREARPYDAIVVGSDIWIYTESGYWAFYGPVPGL